MKKYIIAICSAAVFAAAAAPAPADEPMPRFNVDANGSYVVTFAQMQQVVADEVALRRRFSEPKFYTDRQLTLPEIMNAMGTDPFDKRKVVADQSQPGTQVRDTRELIAVYDAYARDSGLRERLCYLLRMYEARELFGICARVSKAKGFYESEKMQDCLKSLERFNSTFKQLNTTVRSELENGSRLGAGSIEKLTLDHIFSSRTTFSDYINAFGRIKPSFNNPLLVLMRYNARMSDGNLAKFQNASVQMDQDLAGFIDLHKKAVESARNGRSTAGIAQLIELDDRISDCMSLALGEMDQTVKKFKDTGTVYFKLRSGLPCADVFSNVDVDTNREGGPDYLRLVKAAYDFLRRDFEKIYRRKFHLEMDLR